MMMTILLTQRLLAHTNERRTELRLLNPRLLKHRQVPRRRVAAPVLVPRRRPNCKVQSNLENKRISDQMD